MADPREALAFSNSIRLSSRQWLGITLFAMLLVVFAPRVWMQFEDFTPPADYRIPHELSNDYWLYELYAALAAQRYDTLLIGDSVIWGEYVKRQETLAYYLNREAGKERCANLGLDGAHPLALSGLIRHYAGGVVNRNVLLECNPLWLSSPPADLQDDKKVNQFNHPRLVPQFSPRIPSYKEEISPRLGILVEQRVTFSKWTNHLQQPWNKSGITKQDYPWVDLEASLQWHAFQDVIELLRARGNRVFVVVGPFNEHLLTAASQERYDKVKRAIAAWLDERQIPYKMPAPLASEQYADASHPLPQGYATLARQLCDEPFFRSADLP